MQEIRNLHNEQLMGIRREEEMEMSDDDMEDAPDSKDSEDSGRGRERAVGAGVDDDLPPQEGRYWGRQPRLPRSVAREPTIRKWRAAMLD